ncbi:hypothetical protein NLU13_6651 [Sarocladium strictum]|uniref:xylan 1,4-beta-xylosidase n=1 Tax=Sarocladium strictum TaxID=5046 RepID=A0AA39GGA8_SARSR|nr:hypothetical protein NLU13_6651 [Sarocladium strictum]
MSGGLTCAWNSEEALHGLAGSPGVNFAASGEWSYATSFPAPIVMGAAFDDELIEKVATVISTEARAYNNVNRSGLDYWTPNINPYRDPRWGRGHETPGEDPFHIKSYVKSLLQGLQGGVNPQTLKIIATCKHFTAYDIEDWHGNERYGFDAIINSQDLAEYYMQPFQQCARDSKAGSFMCSYNALNGVPTCADPYILQDLLRTHWNWTDPGNYVVSDCDAVQNAYLPHGFKPTREETVAAALQAGTDLDCGQYYPLHLPDAFSQGLFNETVVDNALVKLYSALVRLGYFDPESSSSYRSLGWTDVSTPDSENLARQAAEEGIVLLKNNGILPLKVPDDNNSQKLSVAFIGGWANGTTIMQGTYAGPAPYLHSALMAAQNRTGINALYAGSPGDPTTDGYPRAIAAAQQADVIVYMDGPTTADESESNDRNLIRWSGERIDIMTQLAGMGKPFIIAQMGDQIDNAPFLKHENVSAIIWGGYPGQAGGDAILNILTGEVAPAGRLPVTEYPADYVNQVPMTDMSLRPNKATGNPGRTYMWYNNATLPFGYGLHYTNFSVSVENVKGNNKKSEWAISDLATGCSETYKDLCPFLNVTVSVENAGQVTSDYVALGFLAGDHGPSPRPLKRLVAYTRLHDVKPGSSSKTTTSLSLSLGSLARHNERGDLVLYPGEYKFLVDVPTAAEWTFALTGEELVLDKWPQPRGRAGT